MLSHHQTRGNGHLFPLRGDVPFGPLAALLSAQSGVRHVAAREIRGADLREVKVSWNEDGVLGLYQDNPRIEKGQSIVVDFVYRAPMEPGDYEHGGVMRASSLLNAFPRTVGGDKGGVPINVALAPENVFGSLEGYGVGSI